MKERDSLGARQDLPALEEKEDIYGTQIYNNEIVYCATDVVAKENLERYYAEQISKMSSQQLFSAITDICDEKDRKKHLDNELRDILTYVLEVKKISIAEFFNLEPVIVEV